MDGNAGVCRTFCKQIPHFEEPAAAAIVAAN
jgi:hypothetical protein